MPSAGSLATYAARGLHPAVGFLVAWGYVLVGLLIPPLVLLQLGFTTAATLNSEFHGYPANLWWPWALLGAVIVLAAGFYGIRTSARLGTVLGVFEIGVFVVLAVFFIVHAGSTQHAERVRHRVHAVAYHGITGVIAGSVFTILAFGGFEGAAPLAEEARNPRRTIRRAVLLARRWASASSTSSPRTRSTSRSARTSSATSPRHRSTSWEGMARSLLRRSSGSSSSWRSSTPPSPTRTRA